MDGIVEGRGAEEYPGETDYMECENSSQPLACQNGAGASSWTYRKHISECALDTKSDTMDRSPKDECPVCAVPETAEQHGSHQVSVSLFLSIAATPQRNIQVITEPGTQADVP